MRIKILICLSDDEAIMAMVSWKSSVRFKMCKTKRPEGLTTAEFSKSVGGLFCQKKSISKIKTTAPTAPLPWIEFGVRLPLPRHICSSEESSSIERTACAQSTGLDGHNVWWRVRFQRLWGLVSKFDRIVGQSEYWVRSKLDLTINSHLLISP